jgi:hypothetical protein
MQALRRRSSSRAFARAEPGSFASTGGTGPAQTEIDQVAEPAGGWHGRWLPNPSTVTLLDSIHPESLKRPPDGDGERPGVHDEQPMTGETAGRASLSLKGFVGRRGSPECCELCGNGLSADHPHLLAPDRRRALCACEPCAVLFVDRPNSGYKRVARRITLLTEFELTDDEWDALMIPIDLAFFFYSSTLRQMVAVYPGPAGATESTLRLNAWDRITRKHPRLRALEPDVDAFLVNRAPDVGGSRPHTYLIVPIDECYKLVGLIRKSWRGFSGGAAVWDEIAQYFSELRRRADRASAHA